MPSLKRVPLAVRPNFPTEELQYHDPPSTSGQLSEISSCGTVQWLDDINQELGPPGSFGETYDTLMCDSCKSLANTNGGSSCERISCKKEKPRYETPATTPGLEWKSGSPRRWCPEDEDIAIYGKRIGDLGGLADDSPTPFLATLTNSHSFKQNGKVTGEAEEAQREYPESSNQVPSYKMPENPVSAQNSSQDGSLTLEIMKDVNPRGYRIYMHQMNRKKISPFRMKVRRAFEFLTPASPSSSSVCTSKSVNGALPNFDVPGRIFPDTTTSHSRKRKYPSKEDPKHRHPKFDVFEDEALGEPARKRRFSSHLVRESLGAQYKADLGACTTRSRRISGGGLLAHEGNSRFQVSVPIVKHRYSSSKIPVKDIVMNLVNDPIEGFGTPRVATSPRINERLDPITTSSGHVKLESERRSNSMSKLLKKPKNEHGSSYRRVAVQQVLSQGGQRLDHSTTSNSIERPVRQKHARKTRL